MGAAVTFVVFCLFLYLPHFLGSSPLFAAEEKLIVFGRIQDDPVRAVRDRQEFVDYIAKKLARQGYSEGRILVVGKMRPLARALREGKVDFFHDSVVPTVVLSRWAGAIPIVRQWKYGEAEYDSVILAKKNSRIGGVADLKGKTIGFDEPHSTSANILPRMLLVENELKLAPVTLPGRAKQDEVGFVHGADGNAIHMLVTDAVDAAATSTREFKELRPEIQDRLKIVGRTRSVPRLVISVRKDLDPKVVKALKEIMLNMDKDPDGKVALKKQQRTTKIDEIPPGSFQLLRDIEKFVFSHFGKQLDSW